MHDLNALLGGMLQQMNGHDYWPTIDMRLTDEKHPVRFKRRGDSKRKSSWYSAYYTEGYDGRGYLFGSYGHWGSYGDGAQGKEKHFYRSCEIHAADRARVITHQREHANAERLAMLERQEKAAAVARRLWVTASEEKAGYAPYLERKMIPQNVKTHRVTREGNVLVPRLVLGKLASLQIIYNDATNFKMFLKDGRSKGAYHILRSPELSFDTIFICEGYATAFSVMTATQSITYVAFYAYNLLEIVHIARRDFPDSRIVVCCDDDRWKPEDGNPGLEIGEKAANNVKGLAICPRFDPETDSKQPTDYNDLHKLAGIDEVRKQILGDL